ncbi:MAG: 2,4-dihydroxyhept-2-ene-1,7-dioic acid aldolase [Chloroflexi bacterium]|nr:2,4-dihydroxyhept-2-ene-1,7-dioic acid aldolase [Chloroflexota bacterium]
MRPNKIKALWREGKPAHVGWVATGDSYIAETMAHAGFDGLVLDMQHGMGITSQQAAQWFQAVSTTETVPLVRVGWNDPVHIQWALDAGAYGVIVPLVNSYEEAVRAGGACRYAPVGFRSVGPNRARLYAGDDYVQHSNQEIICLVMIESIEAVGKVEEIARAPGIDGFYIGPGDLALTLGLPGGLDNKDPRHVEACRKVLESAKRHGLVAGIHTTGPEETLRRFAEGYLFCPVASDVGAVAAAAREAVAAMTRGLGARR